MLISLDTETHLITPGMRAPQLVCLSWFDGSDAGLLDREDGVAFARRALERDDVLLIGQNVAYDFGVLCAEDPALLPRVFRVYERGRVRDTKIRQMLLDIADGILKYSTDDDGNNRKSEHSLEALARRLLGKTLAKGDTTWRLRYNELDGVPIDQWPEDARRYALDDARTAFEVYQAQVAEARKREFTTFCDGDSDIPDECRQHRAAWALHLMSTWGVRTEAQAVVELRRKLETERDQAYKTLVPAGLVRNDAGRTRDMSAIRARVEKALGHRARQTPKGAVVTDRDTLLSAGDPELRLLAEIGTILKNLSTYVPLLEMGTRGPLCAEYNPLVESGRTSCRAPNMQNPPRKGGVRECFVPRPGTVFCSVDYDTLEMRTLAQACLDLVGFSRLAEELRLDEDPHLNLAADLLKIPRDVAKRRFANGDPEIDDARQFCKIGNFGFPGGMGIDAFIDYAMGYGRSVSLEDATKLHEAWFAARPEMRAYFKLVSSYCGIDEAKHLVSLRSGMVRGRVRYTAACNHYFQNLAANGAKEALWRVGQECYLGRWTEGVKMPRGMSPSDGPSPLHGCRPVIFLHDQIIMEVPDDLELAHAAGERLAQVLIDTMQEWVPDVPIKASPILMRRWYKKAKTTRNDQGRLVPWEPAQPKEESGL